MPPEVVAPVVLLSTAAIVIVRVVAVGTDVTINFLSAKSAATKAELVIVLNVEESPNNIISPA